jgi:phospholipid transport system substrate-binding protein
MMAARPDIRLKRARDSMLDMKNLIAQPMKNLVAALLLASASSFALAEELAPDLLIRRLSEEVVAAMRADPELRAGNPAKVVPFVQAKVLPHFDFARATQIAMGPAWRGATPAQREELTREFSALLVRTYTVAIAGFSDSEITVIPLRARASETEVTVRSQVKRPGAQPIAVEYEMQKTAAGWKVYDLRIEGISLMTTYRTAFADEVRTNGVDGLIRTLSGKNRHGASKPISHAS